MEEAEVPAGHVVVVVVMLKDHYYLFGRGEKNLKRWRDPSENLILILALVYFSGPEIYFTKFWYVFEEVKWHYMLKEQISTWLGAGKGCPRQG